jgi:hypothetical protein
MPALKMWDGSQWVTVGGVSPRLYAALASLAPVSWWKLDEASGAFADSGSAGIAGTIGSQFGARRAQPGPDRYSHCVTTVANQGPAVATFGNNYAFAGTLPFTFVICHRPTGYGTNSRRVMAKNDSTAGSFIGLDTAGKMFAMRAGSGAAAITLTSTMLLNEWNLYAHTYDGATQRAYCNGESATLADSGSMPTSSTNLRLNGEPTNQVSWGADGGYSNFAVWNRALTVPELDSLYECVR